MPLIFSLQHLQMTVLANILSLSMYTEDQDRSRLLPLLVSVAAVPAFTPICRLLMIFSSLSSMASELVRAWIAVGCPFCEIFMCAVCVAHE